MRVFFSDAIDPSDARLDFSRVLGVAPYWGIDAQRRFARRSFVAGVAPNAALRRWRLIERHTFIARIPSKITLFQGFCFGCDACVALLRGYSNKSKRIISWSLIERDCEPCGLEAEGKSPQLVGKGKRRRGPLPGLRRIVGKECCELLQ
jgi:hypothetical protein